MTLVYLVMILFLVVVFLLFLTTISTNTNIILFSNNLLSVDYFVVFSGL